MWRYTNQTDNTVRDASGNIYQLVYNDNYMDSKQTINGKSCNISRLVYNLNMKYEEMTMTWLSKLKKYVEL